MFIYRVANTVNGKVYIGKTVTTLGRRWTYHKYQAKVGGGCPHLGAAIRKHGPQNFVIELLCTAATIEDLNRLEMQEIAIHHSNDPLRGYNLTTGGEGLIGFHHSEKTKAVMRQKHSGVNHPMFGKHHTDDAKRNISEHNGRGFLGKKHSVSSRLRMGARGEQHSNFGKHLPETTKERIRVANAKTYALLSPAGNILCITNLKGFCKQEGLNYPKMCVAANGGTPHRGWSKGQMPCST